MKSNPMLMIEKVKEKIRIENEETALKNKLEKERIEKIKQPIRKELEKAFYVTKNVLEKLCEDQKYNIKLSIKGPEDYNHHSENYVSIKGMSILRNKHGYDIWFENRYGESCICVLGTTTDHNKFHSMWSRETKPEEFIYSNSTTFNEDELNVVLVDKFLPNIFKKFDLEV